MMNSEGCPVCGYPDITVLDEYGCTTFEICECCGCESGYACDQNTEEKHLMALRRIWLNSEPKDRPWIEGKPVAKIDRSKKRIQKINQLGKAGLDIPS